MQKMSRGKTHEGITPRIKTGCGWLYVTLNFQDGKLFELFVTLGKAGGCAKCQTESVAKLITVALKYGVPLEDLVKKLEGNRCPIPLTWDSEEVLSCSDAIGKILRRYILESSDYIPH